MSELDELRAAALRQPGAVERAFGIKFGCPQCIADGHDKHTDNACLFLNGRWACAWATGGTDGKTHRQAIGRVLHAGMNGNGGNGHHKDRAPAPGGPDGPVLVNLGDVAPESVTWTWEQRVARGKLTVLIGEVGTGKTRVTLDMVSRSTRRLPWPDGGEAPEGDVLMLTSEDGLADVVRPVVDRQGGDPSRVHVLRAVRIAGLDTGFNLERDLPALEQALMQTKAVLLIISPLSAYLGSKNSYQDSEIRGILTPLAALAEQHRVAVVGIMHLTKAAQRKILLRAQGSVAFVAQARTVLVCGKDEQVPGRFVFASVKNNLGPEAATLAYRIIENGLTWEDAPVEGTADQLLAVDEPSTRTESRERDEAATFLRHLLGDGPVASKQVEADAKANGIAQRTLWRAKAELGITAARSRTTEGNTGAWYWSLPV